MLGDEALRSSEPRKSAVTRILGDQQDCYPCCWVVVVYCTVLYDQAPRHPSTYTTTTVRDQAFEDELNQNPTFCESSLVPAKVFPAPE